MGQGLGIVDHAWTDVDACRLQVWIGVGHFQHPASRPTADIQHIVELLDGLLRVLRQQPAHRFREQLVGLDQLHHFCLAIPKQIKISRPLGFIGCHNTTPCLF